MGSAMIGKLILINKKCKSLHLDLRLCGLNDNIMEVFRLMKLDTVLQIYDEESTALKQFKEHKKKWYV
jgi:anti-sigma B factor antagonist